MSHIDILQLSRTNSIQKKVRKNREYHNDYYLKKDFHSSDMRSRISFIQNEVSNWSYLYRTVFPLATVYKLGESVNNHHDNMTIKNPLHVHTNRRWKQFFIPYYYFLYYQVCIFVLYTSCYVIATGTFNRLMKIIIFYNALQLMFYSWLEIYNVNVCNTTFDLRYAVKVYICSFYVYLFVSLFCFRCCRVNLYLVSCMYVH